MGELRYRVSKTLDAEERLEDAAMAKAMKDAFGKRLEIVEDGECEYGRGRRSDGATGNIAYWRDPAFQSNCYRSVKALNFKAAETEVQRIHEGGQDAFVKSTALKLFAMPVPQGVALSEALDALVYSVIDRKEAILVQEFRQITWEHRFVSVGRQIVTHSPVAWHLTPLDRIPWGMAYRTPRSSTAETMDAHVLRSLAERVARDCLYEDVIIDCALIGEMPGVVEFNPFGVGQFGLYACDPRAIADAVAAKAEPPQ